MQGSYEAIVDECEKKMMIYQEINEANLWELYDKKDGYSVYTKKNPENGIKINRTQTEIAFSIDKILEVIYDVNKRKLYDDKVEISQVIEQINNDTRIIYVKLKPPMMLMSSRDIVMVQKIYRHQDGSVVICSKSIIHEKTPPIHKVERGEMSMNGWILTPQQNGMTKIVMMQCFDPKGDIPQSLTNQMAKIQSDTMKAVVKFIAGSNK